MKLLTACASLTLLTPAALWAQKGVQKATPVVAEENPQISYAEFLKVAAKVEPYREQRRVTEEQFLQLTKKKDAIILDTRSQRAFHAAHLKGAVHLNFSDITKESLAKVLGGDKQRVVLIYCNNNFPSQTPDFPAKRRSAALNIPTFITLYAYGYQNLYELGPVVDPTESKLEVVRNADALQRTLRTK